MKESSLQAALRLRARRASDPRTELMAVDHPKMVALRQLTLSDLFERPHEVGEMVHGQMRRLASSQGVKLMQVSAMETNDNEFDFVGDQFGYQPDGNRPPTVFMPKFISVDKVWPDEGAVALAHHFFLWVAMVNGNYECCNAGDLRVPTFSFSELRERLAETNPRGAFASRGYLNHHWYQATVWSRMFFGTNKIYRGSMTDMVLEEDKKSGFYMPDLVGIKLKYPTVPMSALWTEIDTAQAMEILKGAHFVETK